MFAIAVSKYTLRESELNLIKLIIQHLEEDLAMLIDFEGK